MDRTKRLKVVANMAMLVAENIVAAIKGEVPLSLANKDVLGRRAEVHPLHRKGLNVIQMEIDGLMNHVWR